MLLPTQAQMQKLNELEINEKTFCIDCYINTKGFSGKETILLANVKVGETGIEPATSSSRTKHATKLRYSPTMVAR